jgi:hypothetical protein
MTPAQFAALGKRFDSARSHSDLGHGIVASVIANCNRNPKKKSTPFKAKDFMPRYSTAAPNKQKSVADLKQYFEGYVVPAINSFSRSTKKG